MRTEEQKAKEREYQAAYREANRQKMRDIQRRWREKNRDLAKARVDAWKAAHPERQRAAEIAYRNNNAEKRRATCKAYRDANPEKERAYRKQYAAKNLDRIAAKAAARRALVLNATPAWANESKIRALYAKAKRLTEKTGIEHHVDHIVPLKSKFVCGFHCEANLRVIPGSDNLSKGNRSWPDMA